MTTAERVSVEYRQESVRISVPSPLPPAQQKSAFLLSPIRIPNGQRMVSSEPANRKVYRKPRLSSDNVFSHTACPFGGEPYPFAYVITNLFPQR